MTGPDFLRAVADQEAALNNHENADIYRRRADEWQGHLDALETTALDPADLPSLRERTGAYIPVSKRRHAITPTDRH
ncbi:hypothetical protein LVB77_14770 [Lysobacter sp. 5GHs7-4]|uniref:hypothetical protein n=1 Tax=Lysobacter sp. 5GHs7-4 TaxID=2904253 RepID=UPI001E40D205|nr:hypothetical protein [Lysobacter sp. 5GHs7-4]UHQ21929.1 hypothetical protein LVB77_14770 [Lysobacter sp. 5GHs7-4]